MKTTTIDNKAAFLIDDFPDWESKVSATFETVTQFEESLSGKEARRPYAETIRMRLQQSYTLEGTAALKFADALRSYQTQPILVPLYQSAVKWQDRTTAPITGGLKYAYRSDGSQAETYTTVEPVWATTDDYVAPVVWGRLEAKEIRWLNDRVAKFDLDLIENGPASYAITARDVALTDGPSLAGWDAPNRWVGPALTAADKQYRPEYYNEVGGLYQYTPNTFTPLANTGTNAALRINYCLIYSGKVLLDEGVYTLGTAGSNDTAAPYNMILFGDTTPIIGSLGYPKDNVQIIGRGIGKTTLRICDNSAQTRAMTPNYATPAWAAGVNYNVNDYVAFNQALYKCVQAHLSAVANQPPTAGYWVITDYSYFGMPGKIMRMIYSTNPSTSGFGAQPCNNTLIKGISFDANHNEANNNSHSKNCISIFGSGTVIEDCEFYNVGAGSYDLVGGTPESFTVFAKLSFNNADGAQGAIVRRCIFRDTGTCTASGIGGIVAENTAVAVGGYVLGGYYDQNFTSYRWATGVVVEDCKIEGQYNINTQRAPLHGITASITKGAVFTRNFFNGYQGVCFYADTWPQIGTKVYNNRAVNVWGFCQLSAYDWRRINGAPIGRLPHFKDFSVTRNTASIVPGNVTYYQYNQQGGGIPGFVVAYLYDHYQMYPDFPGHTNFEVSGNAFTPSPERPYVMLNIGGYFVYNGNPGNYAPPQYSYVNPTIFETQSGGIVGEFATPKIFNLPIDWREFGQAFTAKVVRERIGFGREQFEKVYTQANASESELRAISRSQAEIGQMLRFFQTQGVGGAFWVPVWRSSATLAANITAASVTFTVESNSGLRVGDWVAFVQPSGIVARAKVTAIAGTTITVSQAPGALAKAETLVVPLVLARMQKPRLQIDWSNSEVAEARFLVSEVPPEYFPDSGQTISKDLGLLLTRGYLYEFTQTIGGVTTTTRLTSYEKALTVLGQSYTAWKIDHGSIKQSLFIDRDEIEIRSDVIAGDPLVKIATNQSEAPLRLVIKSVDVIGSVGTDSQVLFAGDVVSVSVKGSRVSAKAVSAGTVFDRQYPRFRMQVGCNHQLFSAGCTLLASNWAFTGTMADVGSAGYPFTFTVGGLTKNGGMPIVNLATVSRARASSVATVVTSANHNLIPGMIVSISGFSDSSFNGTVTVVSVTNATTFTYASAGANLGTTTDSGGRIVRPMPEGYFASGWIETGSGSSLVRRSVINSTPFSTQTSSLSATVARASNVATLATNAAHYLVPGAVVTITNLADTSFNGTYVVTSTPTTTSFTYDNVGSNLGTTTATGGTIAPRIVVTLSRDPSPYPVNNDAVTLYPGCDGSRETCISKFNNFLNFGGHPFLPTSNPSMFRVSKNIGGGKK